MCENLRTGQATLSYATSISRSFKRKRQGLFFTALHLWPSNFSFIASSTGNKTNLLACFYFYFLTFLIVYCPTPQTAYRTLFLTSLVRLPKRPSCPSSLALCPQLSLTFHDSPVFLSVPWNSLVIFVTSMQSSSHKWLFGFRLEKVKQSAGYV